ncbi:thiol-disulfide oxidoreductase DCC family protein [Bacillus sp. DX1.1]|uniref:thiol-disulfide oxidoreductase DCC family protein n=1 Tax=unclassified Bacillus (in: firmicutes) TaxID=185979 RepID=UPI00257102EC|nr:MULTISPECIES: thiol-disulfide oxidoreductase DCC family protein [unclassified Bacillus (in: firmicutes)]MDM5154936.1 thiol-disulfide oxidoreductase DCC family protein [Bacillus sp. DX1.1]WJE83801.1 thiol-disulfide oxidoreductase DCC family protein [Bacillus sp. DX3.1]
MNQANFSTNSIILFDGVCNLCNFWVQFVIERDPKAVFKFAPLQSEIAKSLIMKYGKEYKREDSIILFEEGKLYTKSTAVLKILRKLRGPIKVLYIFIFIPKFIRDKIYDIVARNRYRWFGKQKSCMISTQGVQNRFLEEDI